MSKLSFLDLPEKIRFQIYELAGPISNHVIRLNNIKGMGLLYGSAVGNRSGNLLDCDRSPELAQIDNFNEERNALLQNLFVTCRQIYHDSSSLVYSRNKVGVRNSDIGNLDRLIILRPRIISCLTNLTIRLNDPRPPISRNRDDYTELEHIHHNFHLDMKSARDFGVISKWQVCARYLFLNIASDTLHLNFICDTRSEELATKAIEPFLSTSNTLKSCNVRLSHEPDPRFRFLSKKASLHSTRNEDELLLNTEPFPFMQLPKEIRLLILEYTDLVTPFCEVEWKREYGMHLHSSDIKLFDRYRSNRGGGIREDHFHEHAYSKNFKAHNQSGPKQCRVHPYTGCFCHRHHGAYTKNCNCWIPPTALFLVCRGLRQDSTEIFFSKNRFIITPEGDPNQLAREGDQDLHIETFLRDVLPQEGLRQIRHLQIVFPPFSPPNEPAYHERVCDFSRCNSWIRAIELISNHLSLSALKLEISAAEWSLSIKKCSQRYYDFRSNFTKEQSKVIEDACLKVFSPLDRLTYLKTLFIWLEWPWFHRSSQIPRNSACNKQICEARLRTMEAIETAIDCHAVSADYDSALHGKRAYLTNIVWRHRMWVRRFSDKWERSKIREDGWVST